MRRFKSILGRHNRRTEPVKHIAFGSLCLRRLICLARIKQRFCRFLLRDPERTKCFRLARQLFRQAGNLGKAFGIIKLTVIPIPLQTNTLALQRLHLPLFILQHVGLGRMQHLDPGTRGIKQIDRLVRQLAPGNVTTGQLSSGDQRIVANDDIVHFFVLLAQPAHDQDSRCHVRLIKLNELKTTRQRGVLFEILLVLGPGRRRDGAQFATRQRRLEQIGRVRPAGGTPCTDHRMRLVDKEDDRLGRFLDLGNHPFQAILEFPLDAGSGLQQSHIKPEKRNVLQRVGYIALDHPQSQTFNHRRFADPGIANANRVVLAPPRKNVDHLPDFLVPAKYRVDFASACFLGEVLAVTRQGAATGDRRIATSPAFCFWRAGLD